MKGCFGTSLRCVRTTQQTCSSLYLIPKGVSEQRIVTLLIWTFPFYDL